MKLLLRTDLCSYISSRLWKLLLEFDWSAGRQYIHYRIFNHWSTIAGRACRPLAEVVGSLTMSALTCLLMCLLALFAGRTVFVMCITIQATIVISGQFCHGMTSVETCIIQADLKKNPHQNNLSQFLKFYKLEFLLFTLSSCEVTLIRTKGDLKEKTFVAPF